MGRWLKSAATPAGAKPGTQVPTFTDLPQGTQWPSGMPAMLAGTAPPGSKVQVFDNDRLVTETVTRQDGKWSLPLSALSTGDHFLTTRAYGPDGALLGESAPAKVTVVGPGTPTLAVRPAATAGVQVTRTALATSAAGTTAKATVTASLATTATRITTATLAATAPLTGPAATVPGSTQPCLRGLAQGLQLPPGAPLTGIATPGTKIQLFDGDKQIAETTTGPDGKWSLALPALSAGPHSLTAHAVGADGSVLGTSAPLSVAVGGTPGTAAQAAGTPGGAAVITGTVRPTGVMTGTPQVARPAGATTGTPGPTRPGGTAALATTAARPGTPAPAVGTAAAAAASAPGGAGVSLPAGAPIFLMGVADPGAKLRIFSDNTQVGETVSDALGQWRLMLPALQSGTHELVARIFDAAGNLVTSSAPMTVTIRGR